MPLLYSMYPRRNGSYSEFCPFQYYDSDKYTAIRVKGGDLVEFRIFPAVKDLDNILWRIELMRIMLTVDGDSSQKVLAMLADKTSQLYKHMRKIYTDTEISEKVFKYVEYAEEYNSVKFSNSQILLSKIKDGATINDICEYVTDPMLKLENISH